MTPSALSLPGGRLVFLLVERVILGNAVLAHVYFLLSPRWLETFHPPPPPSPQDVDLAIILGLCLDVRNSNPRDGLTNEQMTPYIARVLRQPGCNWMVSTPRPLHYCCSWRFLFHFVWVRWEIDVHVSCCVCCSTSSRNIKACFPDLFVLQQKPGLSPTPILCSILNFRVLSFFFFYVLYSLCHPPRVCPPLQHHPLLPRARNR